MTDEHITHLSSLMSLSLPPQLSLVLGDTLAGLGQEEKDYKEEKKMDQYCVYCHTQVDVNTLRTNVVSVKRGRIKVKKISCHRCGKVILTKQWDVSASKSNVKESMQEEGKKETKEIEAKTKKKRKPKETNAGLILPTNKLANTSGICKSSTKASTKNKLKLMMSKSEPASKRGGLQDFLKKL